MFDVWMGDVELTTFVLIFSVAVILPVQLLLCFKVKRNAVRLLPAAVLSILTIVFIAIAAVTAGWDGLGYIFLAVFADMMLFMCGIGWGIWAINRLLKKKKTIDND